MFHSFRPTLIITFILSIFLIAACSSEDQEAAKEKVEAAKEAVTTPAEEMAEEVTSSAKEMVAEVAEDTTAAVDEAATAVEETAEAVVAEAAPAASGKGKETYDGVCFACHAMGIAGAPKLGDKEAWAPRIAQGMDVLYDHSINGFTGPSGSMMPAKGGRVDIADDDIKAAVDYMVAESQ